MINKSIATGVSLVATFMLAACSSTPQSPTSPSATLGGTRAAAADGSTLKVNAPVPVAPMGGARVDSARPTLSWTPATGIYVDGVEPSYEVEVSSGGEVVYTATAAGATHVVGTALVPSTPHTWRVRAREDVAFGPWSAAAEFVTPQPAGFVTEGFRTPDPAPGTRLRLPDAFGVVVDEYNRNFNDWMNSCQSSQGERGWVWLDKLVDRLRTTDLRWGYNGKRGNPNDPSQDVVAYHYGAGNSQFSTQVYIIDVMFQHCGSNPSPAWIDQTSITVESGTVGMFVYPRPGRSTPVTPGPGANARPLPDMRGVLSRFANASDSCPRGLKYVNNPWQDRVIDAFRQVDDRWGYNAKPTRTAADNEGVPVVAAGDEAAYHYGEGTRQGSTEVHLVDLLVGHCGPTPSIGWRVFTGEEPGRWTGAGRF